MPLLEYLTYRLAFHSPNRTQNNIYNIPPGKQYRPGRENMIRMIREFSEKPFERVFITSRDGLRLSARYYHVRDGAPVAIAIHGYRATAVRDFCGGIQICFDAGQNVLLLDQRSCGMSEGNAITFGIKERYDCIDWIRYVLDRFGADTKIALYGISMGAATVLMTSGLPELPEQVRCIVADSPYSSPEAIIESVCGTLKLRCLMPALRRGAKRYADIDLASASAVEAVRHAKVPILIIHGEDDRFVPCGMSREIAEACASGTERHTFPGAAHGISFLKDKPRYMALATRFLNEHLG